MIAQSPGNHRIQKVVLHCAAVPGDWHKRHDATSALKEVNAWHKQNGWKGIGYHFLIMPDGTVGIGRPVKQVGAHVAMHNTGSIGILMIEGQKITEIRPEPFPTFTPLQRATARGIIAALDSMAPGLRVMGHNDLDPKKLCPGFKVLHEEWAPKRAIL